MIGAKEDISGNCDEAEHANDPECAGTPTTGGTVDDSTTSTTVGDSSTSTTAAPAADVRAIDAAGAGTVLVAVEDGSLRLVAATPSSGWQVEVEQAAGREIEVDFRSGTRRVQVNVEFEDGQVRERVRVRDDADNSGGSSGPGSSGVDDSADDHSGPGRSGDDDSADDSVDDSSGHSSDDSADDDSVDDDSGGSPPRQRRPRPRAPGAATPPTPQHPRAKEKKQNPRPPLGGPGPFVGGGGW